LEKLETSENSLEAAVRAARTTSLEELSKTRRSIDFEPLDDIYRTSLETLSETREFILTGNEETLGELLDNHRQIDKHIEAVTAMTRDGRGQQRIYPAIAGALVSLKATSSGLIQYIQQADETREEMEGAENTLETKMELLTLQVHRNLPPAPDNGRKLVLGTIAVMLIATIVVVTFVSRRIALPLASLQELTTRFGAGKLDPRASVHGNDEIGRLANAFNTMADDLAQNMAARQEAERDLKAFAKGLEERVRERTRDLFDA